VGTGAILVFLPGWDEIIRLKEALGGHPVLGRGSYQVLPLHSMVAQAEQRKIFNVPPPGVRKVQLAQHILGFRYDTIYCRASFFLGGDKNIPLYYMTCLVAVQPCGVMHVPNKARFNLISMRYSTGNWKQ
jgi:hypothetical protein